jgi:hypothetical protein
MRRMLILHLILASALRAQSQEETLSGPDSHETGQGPHGHLLVDWGGQRSRLEGRLSVAGGPGGRRRGGADAGGNGHAVRMVVRSWVARRTVFLDELCDRAPKR